MVGLAWRLLKVAWLMPPSRHQAVMFTVARLSRGLLGQRIGAEPAKHRDWRIGGVGDEEGLDVDVDVDVGEHIPNILRKKRKRARGGGGGGWDQIKMKEGVQRWRGAIDEEQRTRGGNWRERR